MPAKNWVDMPPIAPAVIPSPLWVLSIILCCHLAAGASAAREFAPSERFFGCSKKNAGKREFPGVRLRKAP